MIELIQQRLNGYETKNALEEEQAIKEIIQEIILFGLWRSDFFSVAAFQGGTSLRILYGLPRFSEDLDFILKQIDLEFYWNDYLGKLIQALEDFGVKTEVKDRSRMDQRIKKAVIKDNSISNQLDLSFFRGMDDQKQTIKLEIDVNPPAGSGFEYSYKEFPVDYEICHQDLSSNFALKIHALLCRTYIKGRDWFDFSWYVKQKVKPNLKLLNAALVQFGPWEEQDINVDNKWLKQTLTEKISGVDWGKAATDVERFLNTTERESLQLWNKNFFLQKVTQLFD